MHTTAMQSGEMFFDHYWQPSFDRILDVGSRDVTGGAGSLRGVAPRDAKYVGIDLSEGLGVDQVLDDPYVYPFPDGHFDAIVSTSCWEHDQLFWLTFLESIRVLSDRGFLYVNAPSSGPYHGYPFDHWRFYPDAGVALERWGRRMKQPVSLVESFVTTQGVNCFNDCVMIFTKQQGFVPDRYILDVRDDRHHDVYNARKGSGGSLLKVKIVLGPKV
jgi:Methyltransferase domain